MVQFFNEVFACYQKFVEFLFQYNAPGTGIPFGYLILASMIFIIVVDYILRTIR